ncbi:MAG TPA: YdcF family protein, partial [Clostridia bacterium]|nr:YdcF family protein [Clostridia bacterium]
ELKLGFVTTDFHVYRAGRTAKKLGITAFGISAPDIWYLSLNNCLRESVAIWAYLLMGRI